MKKRNKTRAEKIFDLQSKRCDEEKWICFLPEDCICEYCKKDMSIKITEKKALTEVITSCPYCNRSFIE
jgi:hypothetical protein